MELIVMTRLLQEYSHFGATVELEVKARPLRKVTCCEVHCRTIYALIHGLAATVELSGCILAEY